MALRAAAPGRPGTAGTLAVTAAVSFCSLVYQMAIAGSFVLMTGDDVFWQSVTLGLYLASLGAGTFAAGRLGAPRPWEALWSVEAGLAVAGTLCVFWVLGVETAYRVFQRFYAPDDFRSLAPYMGVLSLGHASTVLIGVLSGFEIPLLIRACPAPPSGGERIGLVLGVNYFGALAGGLAFSFFLLPRRELVGAATAASAVNLAVCLILLARRAVAASPARLAAAALALAVWGLAALGQAPFQRFYVLNYYADQLGLPEEFDKDDDDPDLGEILGEIWSLDDEDLRHWRSRYQWIDIVDSPSPPTRAQSHFNGRLAARPDLPHGLTLFLDRRYQFTGRTEPVYHEHMAHVPVELFGRVPRDALILGGGDGLLARELLKYGDRLRSITNVELDPEVARLASDDPDFRALNGSSLRDPKVRVVIDDAFSFVRNSRERYDAVYIDFPYPYTYGLTKLYSLEFYRGVSRLLAEGGFGVIDYPLVPEDPEEALEEGPDYYRDNSIIFNTLRAAGFKTVVPYNTNSPELVTPLEARLMNLPDLDPDPEVDALLWRAEVVRYRRRYPKVRGPQGASAGPPAADARVVDNSQWYEAMVAFTRESVRPDFAFKDHGIELFNLDPDRLAVIEGGRFPFAEGPEFVNSVFRPRLFTPVHLEEAAHF